VIFILCHVSATVALLFLMRLSVLFPGDSSLVLNILSVV
jgi:hypothetical protein